MQKQSSTQSVPKLPKAQKGKTVFSLKDYASNINTLSNDNIPRKPAFAKEFEQRQAFYKQQKERELTELQEREFNNRSYIWRTRIQESVILSKLVMITYPEFWAPWNQ